VVTPDGRRSESWRIWTVKNANDLYVAARQSAGWIKASFHESGDWRHGYISQQIAEEVLGERLPREFYRWNRPAEHLPGWTAAGRVIIPVGELRADVSGSDSGKGVIDVTADLAGDAILIEIWIEGPGSNPALATSNARPLGALGQPGGGTVWILASGMDLPWDPRDRFRSEILEAESAAGSSRHPTELRRIVVHNVDDSGTLTWVELAIDP
jgi:hypothetical protein